MSILVAIKDPNPEIWSNPLQVNLPNHNIIVWNDDTKLSNTEEDSIKYAFAWKPPSGIFKHFLNLEVIFSLGAGVDNILSDPNLPNVPIVRYVSPDLTMRIGEWVVLQVLFHMRHQSAYQSQQSNKNWSELPQPAASEINVGVLGLGVLGKHVANLLSEIGFNVLGWSRSAKEIKNIQVYSGAESLSDFLTSTDILVNLLPYTPQTHRLLNLEVFQQLRGHEDLGGPIFINAGRGKTHVEKDIITALDQNILAGVSLDVFEVEPLPSDSPLWNNQNIVITPHVAAISDPKSLASYVANQITKYEETGNLDNVIDPGQGY